jgi:hypothetical protein
MEARRTKASEGFSSSSGNDIQTNSNASNTTSENNLTDEELAIIISENFQGKQVIKSDINNFLLNNNIQNQPNASLKILLEQKKATYEERTSKNGNHYQLWKFI